MAGLEYIHFSTLGFILRSLNVRNLEFNVAHFYEQRRSIKLGITAPQDIDFIAQLLSNKLEKIRRSI